MTLQEKKTIFAHCIALLVLEISKRGYSCTLGDGQCRDGHIKDSYHYKGLAQDVNLFKNGKYLTKTEDHEQFGQFWKSLNRGCTWGGDFKRKDGNHYSFGEGTVC